MRFVPAVIAATLLGIVASVRTASAGAQPNKAPNQAIFVANDYDVTAYPLGSTGDVPPIAVTTDFASPSAIARDSSGRLYVTNQVSNTVTIFPAGANGNTRPLAVIGGSKTRLSKPSGIALGSDGTIYVANSAGTKRSSVTVYPPLSGSGILNESPISEISGSRTLLDNPSGVALDSHGNICVTNPFFTRITKHKSIAKGRITIYPAGSSGNVAPVATIRGDRTGLAFPSGIALDSANNIYVANISEPSITVYSAGSDGNVLPIASIAGSNTALSPFGGIAVDSSGSVYAQGCPNGKCYSIVVYPPGSNGNVSPATVISGAGITDPVAVALDPAGNLYVLNDFDTPVPGGGISIYPAGSSGDATPLATIQDNLSGLADAAGVALDSSGTIYVADTSGGLGGSIDSYPAGSYAAAVPPATTITGPDTQLDNPSEVAVDSNGDIFALNSDAVTEYPAGSTGDALPNAIFAVGGSVSLTGMAVNDAGKLYVTVGATFRCHRRCHQTNGGKVLIWPAGSDGSSGPSTVISGANTGLDNPLAIAVDDARKIYVANEKPPKPATSGTSTASAGESGSLTVYAAGSSGDAAPMATISGPNTGLYSPSGISIDANGNIYVLSFGSSSERAQIPGFYEHATGRPAILIFAAGSNGDVAPIGSISGPFTGLDDPEGIAIGPTGN
jgi:hypothetical protein